ncbi:MAG TPA: hypothetical protein VNO50_10975 [Pyrinomonadaceae bacterium]|nr:hypothetical protein [Pyrinomonadaceae bacterium]
MPSKATGATNIVLKTVTARKRSDGGFFLEEIWEGTREAITALYGFHGPSVGNGIAELEASHDGPKWQLRLVKEAVPSSYPVVTATRLINHRVQKSIFEPPGPNGITEDELRDIKRFIDDNTFSDFTVPWSEAAGKLYSLALRGVTSRVIEQPFLIKTLTSLNTTHWNVSYANVGAIIGNGSIIADAAVGADLRIGLPSHDSAPPDGFVYGWLKHGPQVEPGSGNLSVLTQEYEYGLWSTFLYGNLI